MKKIKVIVTVDTEGDNLWEWEEGKPIDTQNAHFLVPFQSLCEKYGFYPVYLTNYEMAMSDDFTEFAKERVAKGTCEIGMHLHAWNSPPEYDLNKLYDGNAYITEYPKEVILEKHIYLKNLIEERIGVSPVTYRAGRWATSQDLFDVLEEIGILVDCSITPGIYHKAPGTSVQHANNYKKASKLPHKIGKNLIEVPMTTRTYRTLNGEKIFRKIINVIRGEHLWLRPALQSEDEMKFVINKVLKENSDYLMFMIHSSELMPGGNPYCKTDKEVDELLNKLDHVFSYVSSFGTGILLKDYYKTAIK